MPKASKSKIAANARYSIKAYDRVELKIKKGKKSELQTHAQARGESLNGFVNRAIAETLERDKAGKSES
jgi:uncharacterized protein (DUF1778 family)